jgi:hypothetical protein
MTAQDFGNFFPLLSSGSSDSNSMSSQLEQDLIHMSSRKGAFFGGTRDDDQSREDGNGRLALTLVLLSQATDDSTTYPYGYFLCHLIPSNGVGRIVNRNIFLSSTSF